jgi:glycosyltransferase involved in cell wall biosynthesis
VQKSGHVLTVSEAVRSQITSTFGHGEKITVTPNGVEPVFTTAGPRAEGRYFLFVGNDKPHKNVDRLVQAFERFADVQLVLAGGTFDRFRDRRGVVLAGFVGDERLAALYRGAIALVLPSLEEGFGLPALEAMACGTAVITSTAPALIEVTADAALHIDPRSTGAIADAMTRMLHDEALRATMMARGIARASNFTWRRCAEMTREIYRRIA